MPKVSPKFSIEKARAMQLQLSKRLIRKDMLPETIRHVAGVDIAYIKRISIGAVVVLDSTSLSVHRVASIPRQDPVPLHPDSALFQRGSSSALSHKETAGAARRSPR